MNIKKSALITLLGATMTINSNVLVLNQENFTQTIESSTKPVIVDFYADWCQPCKLMKPILEELAQEYSENYIFAQINVDQNSAIGQSYKITMLPTFIVLSNNKRIGAITGYMTKEQFKAKLEDILNPKEFSSLTPVEKASQLRDAISAGDTEQVQELIVKGADVSFVFSDGQTPLFFAILRLAQHPQGPVIIKMLLDAGASTKITFPGQPTADLRDFIKMMITSSAATIEAYNKLLPLFEAPIVDHEKANCTDGVCTIR